MTARTSDALASAPPAFHLADDPNGCPTIWNERHEAVATLDNVILLGPEYRDLVWDVLTRVLAPDEATIERLARVNHARVCGCTDRAPLGYRNAIEDVLAALADTSAQARHTDGNETGGA